MAWIAPFEESNSSNSSLPVWRSKGAATSGEAPGCRHSWLRSLQIPPALVSPLLALAGWNGDPLPTLLGQEPGEVHDLADVVGGMGQRPMDGLEDGVLLPADRHLLQQVCLLEVAQGLEKGGPPSLPGDEKVWPGVF